MVERLHYLVPALFIPAAIYIDKFWMAVVDVDIIRDHKRDDHRSVQQYVRKAVGTAAASVPGPGY